MRTIHVLTGKRTKIAKLRMDVQGMWIKYLAHRRTWKDTDAWNGVDYHSAGGFPEAAGGGCKRIMRIGLHDAEKEYMKNNNRKAKKKKEKKRITIQEALQYIEPILFEYRVKQLK